MDKLSKTRSVASWSIAELMKCKSGCFYTIRQ